MEISGQLHIPVALWPKIAPGTHGRGGLVDPRADLDVVTKREKILASAGN